MAGVGRKVTPVINVPLVTRTVPSVVAKDTSKQFVVVVTEALEDDPNQEDAVALHRLVQPMKGLDREPDVPQ